MINYTTFAAAALALGLFGMPASAGPAVGVTGAAKTGAATQLVGDRNHGRRYYRGHHRGHGHYERRYGYGPSINLRIGRDRHHRRDRHW